MVQDFQDFLLDVLILNFIKIDNSFKIFVSLILIIK